MIVSDRQAVSIHTRTGVQLYQYLPSKVSGGDWNRKSRDVSSCSLTLPPDDHLDQLDLWPWVHWVSVFDYDSEDLLWTGPIGQVQASRQSLNIEARDIGAFMSRTRCPITKKWDATDPAQIAAELWQDMLEIHGINAEPVVQLDPYGSVFDYEVTSDRRLVNEVMDELVSMGLRWTVVSGVPVLGPAPRNPIEALGPEHFAGDGITLNRDGANSYNNVLLLAGDAKSYARVPMQGLDLQTIFTRDSLSGASAAEKAAYEAARYYASFRDSITIPGGSQLVPDAPLEMAQLIPSVRVTVEAYGQNYTMSMEQVSCEMGAGGSTVSVTLESVTDDLPELSEVNGVQTGGSRGGGVVA